MEVIVFIILQIFFERRIWGTSLARDAFRPIACERKYLMDFKEEYTSQNQEYLWKHLSDATQTQTFK